MGKARSPGFTIYSYSAMDCYLYSADNLTYAVEGRVVTLPPTIARHLESAKRRLDFIETNQGQKVVY